MDPSVALDEDTDPSSIKESTPPAEATGGDDPSRDNPERSCAPTDHRARRAARYGGEVLDGTVDLPRHLARPTTLLQRTA